MNEHTRPNQPRILVDRRKLLKGAAVVSLVTLPFASVLATSAPAQEAGVGTTMVSLKTKGGQDVSGALALPSDLASGAKVPAVLLVHADMGLDDQSRAMARALADEGYVVLAADLYKGVSPKGAAEARFQVRNVKEAEATDTLASWAEWLRAHGSTTDKLGCLGGGWSLDASMATSIDATVIYYGSVARTAEELRNLDGPVIAHFGTRDMYINRETVGRFESEMSKAGRVATVHWYDADHGFADQDTNRYNEEEAKAAWARTLNFFKAYLG